MLTKLARKPELAPGGGSRILRFGHRVKTVICALALGLLLGAMGNRSQPVEPFRMTEHTQT